MTDPVRPPSPAGERRGGDRRQALRRAKVPDDGRDLVPLEPVQDHGATQPAPSKDDGASTFEAQRLGQDGMRRGLKGGQEVLTKARSTYLNSEYSGGGDRRPKPGLVKKTDI